MSKHVCSVCSGQLHLFLLPVTLKYRLVLLDELLAFCLSCFSSWNTPFLLSAPQKSSMSLRTQHGISHSPTQCFLTPVQCQGLGFWLWASMSYIQAYPIIQLSTLLISPWVFNFVSLAPGPQQTLHNYLQTKLNIPKVPISQTPKTEYLNFQNKP